MKKVSSVCTIMCLTLAAALPSSLQKRALPTCDLITKRSVEPFDLTPAPPVGGVTTPPPSAVLKYPGFSLVNLNNTGSVVTGPGLQAASSPNAITSGPVDKITSSSQPKFGKGDDSVNRFTMDTLSYACALAGQSVAPTMCTIALTGVKADGSEDVSEVLSYNPTDNEGGTGFATTNLGPSGFTDLLEVKLELVGFFAKDTAMFFDDAASIGCLIDTGTGGTTS